MIFTIAGKELKTLFASPLAWLVLTVVQLIVAYAFLRRLDDFLQVQPQLIQMASPPGATELIAAPAFATAAAVFLFAVPLLAMRLVAEERRNQTLVLLVSAPVSMTEIVLGKFLGLLAFLAAIIGLVVLMPLSLAPATQLDYGLLAGFAGGLVLLSACFAAVGLFVSCLTMHPVAAAFGAFAALLGMLLVGDVAADGLRARGWSVAASLAQVLSPIRNFEPFGRGLLDTYAIACSLLLTVAFLALAVRSLDARRLRG
jgi:ABC-2 type transport system permease protein